MAQTTRWPLEPALTSASFRSGYELGSLLGVGGFGRVYRARQRSTGQQVAVKVIALREGDDEDGGSEGDALARFRKELEVCASLHHPNIVRLIDSGNAEENGSRSIFAVFELVPGTTLADLIGAEGALRPVEAMYLMEQVVDALACAHAAGVVHRDLKPSNVMITSTGARRNALVLDFGLGTFYERELATDGRLTGRGGFVGTPAYAGPEQLRGERADPRTDLFAWGIVLLECLTGRPVLEGPVAEIIHRQLSAERIPVPEAIAPLALGRLVASVTNKDPLRRPASAVEVLDQLKRIDLDQLPGRDEIADFPITRSRERVVDAGVEITGHWLVPLHRNPNFTGREDLLARMREALRGERRLPLVALAGTGGVGKTQIALEYAYRYGYEYDVVAWLRAESPETLAEEYASLALGLALPEGESPDQQGRIEATRRWLEQHRDWLLVFDNAQNPDAIRRFLPRSAGGHVLVTSRHPSWRSLGASLEVDELALEEAVGFLLRRTGEGDRPTAERLAEMLGRLPLALEGAAAYIESTGRSLRGYSELLATRQREPSAGSSLPNLLRGLRGAWEISFQQVEAERPEAADLLHLLAFLAPDDIPFWLIEQGRSHLPERLATALGDPVELDACVAALRRYSLIKVEREAASLHRMVQLATRSRLTSAAHDEWARRALDVAEASFPTGLAGDFFQPEARRLLPHALTALSYESALPGAWRTAGRLQRSTGLYLSALGLQAGAAASLERALEYLRADGPSSESDVADTLADLGLVLYALGDLDGAAARERQALALHEGLHGARDLHVAVDRMSLAWVLRSQGSFQEVREQSERAHEIAAEVLGESHPLVAMPLGPLSRAQWGLGLIDEARRTCEQAMALLKDGSVHHPLVCACWYSVGQVQFDLGHTEAAAHCADVAIEIGERAYGEYHPQVAVSRTVRGMAKLRSGDLEAAGSCFSRAIEAGERSCHRQHEDMAIARCLLSRVQRARGEHETAASSLERARATLMRVCGERSRSAFHVELEFGLTALEDATPGRAAEHAEEALRVLTGYPDDHPYRIPALNLLARARAQQGQAAPARVAATRVLDIGERAFSGVHPDLADARQILEES